MRVYFIFDLKKEYLNLYKGNENVLFNILKQIYYLEKEEKDGRSCRSIEKSI